MTDGIDLGRRGFFGLAAGAATAASVAPSREVLRGANALMSSANHEVDRLVVALEADTTEFEHALAQAQSATLTALKVSPSRRHIRPHVIDPKLDPDIDALHSVSRVMKHTMQRERDRQQTGDQA